MDRRLSLTGLNLRTAADGGILRAAQIAEAESALTLIEEAEARAATIVADAETVREEARREGHAEGLAQAAREAAQRMAVEEVALDSALARIEGQLAELVSASVLRIIGTLEDGDLVTRTVRTALSTLRTERRVRLYVPHGAADEARAAVEAAHADLPGLEMIDVIEDAALVPPQLRLESDMGVVRFDLDDTEAELGALLYPGG
ncbi:type III secretion system stator protein SctL [Marivita sp. GX14005]|uniref:type III secretion system stator protein SctL n=1 Tax=Marivita sp. GX14005 TaxID=2942276 RepID=UPI002019AF33|nr:type III secretion system stator protein SctL [Marivita sp. GX14005]MCL3883305.1 type III secretion system stator protein SctL [Marivita sp. GX14005]